MNLNWRLLLAIFCTILCFGKADAQGSPAIRNAMAACGPADSQFDVSLNTEPPAKPAMQDQALVYVIGNWYGGELGGPVIRIGVNGTWVGALKGTVHFAIPLKAGAYHFCAQGQGHNPPGPREVALNFLHLKPRGTYYLLADSERVSTSGFLGLEELNADEGKLLLAQSKSVVAKPKAGRKP
jgi:hypothetical protein